MTQRAVSSIGKAGAQIQECLDRPTDHPEWYNLLRRRNQTQEKVQMSLIRVVPLLSSPLESLPFRLHATYQAIISHCVPRAEIQIPHPPPFCLHVCVRAYSHPSLTGRDEEKK